jgi:Xaa-Pro aminopeptidase
MSIDIPSIQRALRDDGLDGWLLYDFHGSNPIAAKLAGVLGRHTTRRWYCLIPVTGEPVKLVHAIEPDVLDGVPGERRVYAGRRELDAGIRGLVTGAATVAMEYSPNGAIPYVSRVDAGTVEFVRSLGVRVVSSGDLVGRFEAVWDAAALETHREASARLYRIKDRAFEYIGDRLDRGNAVHEFEVQGRMAAWLAADGLLADAPPIVAAQENAGNPHYSPTPTVSRPIRSNEVVVLDLWAKLDRPGAVYADITWTGFTGSPSAEVARVFEIVAGARDAAIKLVQARTARGEALKGWEVDRAARDVVAAAGYGDRFIHRTGHSLGEEVHGNGVHMDDYETHDDRRLLPGTGFTIEPGIYLTAFGVRSEINMVIGPKAAEVTGPCQEELVRIGRGGPGGRAS